MEPIRYLSKNGISFNHETTPASGEVSFYPAEAHPNIEVLLLLSGKVDHTIDGTTYHLHPGDFLIINAWMYHSSKIDLSVPYSRFNLHFPPHFIPKLIDLDLSTPFSNTHLYQHILPEKLVAKSKIESIMRKISAACRKTDKYTDAKIISLINDLLIETNQTVDSLLSDNTHLIPTPKSTNDLLHATIKYVNSHLTENISTKDLVDHLGVSESYLYHFFKSKMNISLHGYIQSQKMQYALSLIRKGHQPQNVSEMLGYDYYATFFTQFKRIFGKNPSDFSIAE